MREKTVTVNVVCVAMKIHNENRNVRTVVLPPLDMSSLIGKPLQGGKYKLEAVLGRGGFGLTFRAHQNYLDSVVVIKTLNESFWSAPDLDELQRQFQDEARRLALCSHPNVVRVSDFFVEDSLPYMVMDYIPGRSLYDMVLPSNRSANPLSEPVAVRYCRVRFRWRLYCAIAHRWCHSSSCAQR